MSDYAKLILLGVLGFVFGSVIGLIGVALAVAHL